MEWRRSPQITKGCCCNRPRILAFDPVTHQHIVNCSTLKGRLRLGMGWMDSVPRKNAKMAPIPLYHITIGFLCRLGMGPRLPGAPTPHFHTQTWFCSLEME